MATATKEETRLPEGYVALPIQQCDEGATLRVCVLAKETPEPAAGSFVLLRDQHDARVYLGALVDAGGKVREWLELWVQDVSGLESSLPAQRESFSNYTLDARWAERAEAFRALDGAGFLRTGWETRHPLPTFLDLSTRQPVHPGTPETGGHWELCQDDKLLQGAGLPAYRTSLFRYLYQPAAAAGTKFVPVTGGAPENASTQPLGAILAGVEQHLAFNPQGGLLLAFTLSPLAYEQYVDLLGGKSWPGLEHGKKRIGLDGPYAGLTQWEQAQQDNSHLFLGLHGRAGRFLETYHLKLQLLTEAIRQVRAFVQRQQLPFLNLSSESFRVRLESGGAGVPVLWTSRCALVKPGTAFALPVETSDFRYFVRARTSATSIFLPEGLSSSLQGSGSIRIRKVLPPDQGNTVLEATLVMQEQLPVSQHDLLWLRLPLPSGRLDLYGHLYATEAMAQGEIRVRTVPQRLPDSVVANLKAAEGVSFARAPFEVVPLLSTPCDLYALGVLAVRTLLVDAENALPIALDEMLSLARQAGAEHKPELSAGSRIRAILARDARYAASLGPHRLNGGLTPEDAARLLPAELWSDTLGVVGSLFPGLGPDSVCRDFGDVPALALESVFNRPLEELEKLLVRSRSLIVIDWTYNEEIHSAINTFLARA